MKEPIKEMHLLAIFALGYIGIIFTFAVCIYLLDRFSGIRAKDFVPIAGTFGDTIGGLFSPLIGLITFYLVVQSYNKQVASHSLEESTENYAILSSAIDELEKRHSSADDTELVNLFYEIYTSYELPYDTEERATRESAIWHYKHHRYKILLFASFLEFYSTVLELSRKQWELLPEVHKTILKKKLQSYARSRKVFAGIYNFIKNNKVIWSDANEDPNFDLITGEDHLISFAFHDELPSEEEQIKSQVDELIKFVPTFNSMEKRIIDSIEIIFRTSLRSDQ